jgi:hypothetical protein
MTRWLIIVQDDIAPQLKGPFKSDRARLIAAHKHRTKDFEGRDGLYRLDISASGSPRVNHFISREVNPELT